MSTLIPFSSYKLAPATDYYFFKYGKFLIAAIEKEQLGILWLREAKYKANKDYFEDMEEFISDYNLYKAIFLLSWNSK